MQHPTAKNKHMKLALIALVLLGSLLPACLAGCSGGEKYRVDYGGGKDLYSNAKDSYRAGTQVTLYFDLIATDTDYSFLLDGEPVNFTYDDKKGFVIQFTMPDHDVKLECDSRNSMLPMENTGSLGVVNPLSASTLEELAENTGYTLTLPEDTFLDVTVTRIAGEPPLYTVDFLWGKDGTPGTFRLLRDPEAGDISGMYYQWTEENITGDYKLYCSESGQGILLWQDGQASFSLAMTENASRAALLEMQALLLSAMTFEE